MKQTYLPLQLIKFNLYDFKLAVMSVHILLDSLSQTTRKPNLVLSTFANCLAWETKRWVICTRQIVQFWLQEKSDKQKKKGDFICFTTFHRRDVCDVGDFTYLAGEREKQSPGGRLPLSAGELEALPNPAECICTHARKINVPTWRALARSLKLPVIFEKGTVRNNLKWFEMV